MGKRTKKFSLDKQRGNNHLLVLICLNFYAFTVILTTTTEAFFMCRLQEASVLLQVTQRGCSLGPGHSPSSPGQSGSHPSAHQWRQHAQNPYWGPHRHTGSPPWRSCPAAATKPSRSPELLAACRPGRQTHSPRHTQFRPFTTGTLLIKDHVTNPTDRSTDGLFRESIFHWIVRKSVNPPLILVYKISLLMIKEYKASCR